MTYKELKEKHQKEVNDFPLGFCFSNKQAEEMMSKWGLDWNNKDDLKQIVSIGSGGYMRKTDIPAWNELCKRHNKEMSEFRRNERELINGIFYEMCNHEFVYSYDEEPVLNAVGLSKDSFKDEYVVKCWNKALKKYKKACEENEWY